MLQEQFGLTWRRLVPRSMIPKEREPTRGMPEARVMRKGGMWGDISIGPPSVKGFRMIRSGSRGLISHRWIIDCRGPRFKKGRETRVPGGKWSRENDAPRSIPTEKTKVRYP
jgi:hypothetical protein